MMKNTLDWGLLQGWDQQIYNQNSLITWTQAIKCPFYWNCISNMRVQQGIKTLHLLTFALPIINKPPLNYGKGRSLLNDQWIPICEL